jgi:protein-S-isoprenylcysteine O-methyltransferase Ste14
MLQSRKRRHKRTDNDRKNILTYILLSSFFGIDFIIRKDKTAKSIEKTKDDNKSTLLIVLTFFVVLVLSIALNIFKLGTFENLFVARIGLGIMFLGLLVRIASMLTLSKYYTRTLITVDEQQIVKKGLYKVIRHPGYLGTILIWSAAGLGMTNKIVFIAGTILIFLAYYYRIANEEKMLQQDFGERYSEYMKHSWRLIPFLW